jgi:hypothetical protein
LLILNRLEINLKAFSTKGDKNYRELWIFFTFGKSFVAVSSADCS